LQQKSPTNALTHEPLQRPRDVCLTAEHDIVVVDTGNDRLQIFSRDGSVSVLGMGSGSAPGQVW